MDNFINNYCKLLTKLNDYKKKIVDLGNKKNYFFGGIYKKYIDDIDNLLFEKYLKLEDLIKEANKK